MTQTSPMEPFERHEEIVDYSRQAREFLAKSRQYLAEDDLHQAAEKGWGAAAWMAKAVAVAQEWEYNRHAQFNVVMYQAQDLCGDARLDDLRGTANELHGYFYTRKIFLRADVISRELDRMALLLDILTPLTETN
ncbi:MAG: hypothetical protein F4X64_05710 [Chloroflexi bacterium]|nr:hypothetical protein [Chloroflexota bacterium]